MRYSESAEIEARRKKLSRIANKTPKRIIEARKAGPCTVMKFEGGHLLEALVEKGADMEMKSVRATIAEIENRAPAVTCAAEKFWTPQKLHSDADTFVVPTPEQASLAGAL